MNPLISKYQQIAGKSNLSDNTKKSKESYARKVSQESTIHDITKLSANFETPRKVKTGMMLMYEYLPKGSGILPYWDRHPLVYVLQVNLDGWTGINFHYLHPIVRVNMFYDMDRRKIDFGSNQISRHATKKYLSNRVVGKVKEVPSSMWEVVSQMPFENFQDSNKYSVWKDTNRKLK